MIAVAAILTLTSSRSAADGTWDGIQKIDQLWMVIYVDDAGREIVAREEHSGLATTLRSLRQIPHGSIASLKPRGLWQLLTT
jgi:hypothetical protein